MYRFKDLDERVQHDPRKYMECKSLPSEKTTISQEFMYYFSYELDGRLIGNSEVLVDLKLNDVVWSSFFPLTFLAGARRRGLGTLTHVITLETLELAVKTELGVDLRSFSVGHFTDIQEPRLGQLEKMGIRWDRMIPYDEYMRISREYGRRIGIL